MVNGYTVCNKGHNGRVDPALYYGFPTFHIRGGVVGVAAVKNQIVWGVIINCMPLWITIAYLPLWTTTTVYPQIQVCCRDNVETHLTRVSLLFSLSDLFLAREQNCNPHSWECDLQFHSLAGVCGGIHTSSLSLLSLYDHRVGSTQASPTENLGPGRGLDLRSNPSIFWHTDTFCVS